MNTQIHKCLVLMRKEKEGTLGKREAHPKHDWWYTSSGGGHQMNFYDPTEKNVKKWHCPGRD